VSHLLAGIIEGLMALSLFLGALAFAVAVERIRKKGASV
jgi:hypothetical protein